MGNIELHKRHKLSAFRKLSLGTWRTAYDPSVYGTMQIRMDKAMDYLARFRAATGKRLTVSHMMAKAAAASLKRMPDANAILRYRRPYRRKKIGIFFQVAMTDEGDDKVDLSGATIYDVDEKSLTEVIDEFEEKVELVRKRKDPALEKTRKQFSLVPAFLMGFFLKIISFLCYTLNLKLPGVPRDPFGSMMVTNIGSLGLDVAYVPLVPYSRVPILLATGAVKDVPVVTDGQLSVGKMMSVSATLDHRFVDGHHAAVMSGVIHKWFDNPDEHFGPIEDVTPPA